MAKSFFGNWAADLSIAEGSHDYCMAVDMYGEQAAKRLVEVSNSEEVRDYYADLVIYMGGEHSEIVNRLKETGIQVNLVDGKLCEYFASIDAKLAEEISNAMTHAAWPTPDADTGKYLVSVNVDALKSRPGDARPEVAAVMEMVNLANLGKCDFSDESSLPTPEEVVELIGWLPKKFIGLL